MMGESLMVVGSFVEGGSYDFNHAAGSVRLKCAQYSPGRLSLHSASEYELQLSSPVQLAIAELLLKTGHIVPSPSEQEKGR